LRGATAAAFAIRQVWRIETARFIMQNGMGIAPMKIAGEDASAAFHGRDARATSA
jgi:hypothetical protein